MPENRPRFALTKKLPCALKIGAGFTERRGGAALMLARIRSRIEATAPFPSASSVRVADALGDRTGMDVAVIDQPAFLPVVQGSAAVRPGIGDRPAGVRPCTASQIRTLLTLN